MTGGGIFIPALEIPLFTIGFIPSLEVYLFSLIKCVRLSVIFLFYSYVPYFQPQAEHIPDVCLGIHLQYWNFSSSLRNTNSPDSTSKMMLQIQLLVSLLILIVGMVVIVIAKLKNKH